MAEHPVKRKLRNEILPYLVSSRKLPRLWFYRLHLVFGYTTDLVVALAAVGVATPLLQLLAGTSGTDGSSPSLGTALAGMPRGLAYATAVGVIGWILLRVGFNREDGQKRAVLARSCVQTMRQAEARLHRILLKADPMPDLVSLATEEIGPTVDRNVQENAWPWSGPDPEAGEQTEATLAAFCAKYESNWTPVDPTGIRS